MAVDTLADAIIRFVTDRRNVSFAVLAREWPEHFSEGVHDLQLDGVGVTNIVLWRGLSEIGLAAIHRALGAKALRVDPTHPLAYIDDGLDEPPYPIASLPQHDTPHWWPVVLNPVLN